MKKWIPKLRFFAPAPDAHPPILNLCKKITIFFMSAFTPLALYGILQVLSCFYLDDIFEYSVEKSSVPIEVVFVTASRDFDVLPYSVASVRKYLRQPIAKMVLISPKSEQAINLAKSLDMEYVDENSILNLDEFKHWVTTNNMSLNLSWQHHSKHRLTWYYQQFLKLLYHKKSHSQYYLVIDADVVMQKPFVMVSDYKVHSFFVGETLSLAQYKQSTLTLLGEAQFIPEFSYVSHMMCFNKKIVANMIRHIEGTFNTKLYKAAILAEQNSKAVFSEYQLYGVYSNFVEKNQLASYIPRSNYIGQRTSLFLDKYNSGFKKAPYIAYHYYANNHN